MITHGSGSRLRIFEYFRTSSPIIKGEDPSTRSNRNDVGLLFLSMMESVHAHIADFGSRPSFPHPCEFFLGGSKCSDSPRISQRYMASSIPPQEISAPSSRMGLGSARSSASPFTENTNEDGCHHHENYAYFDQIGRACHPIHYPNTHRHPSSVPSRHKPHISTYFSVPYWPGCD